MKKLKVSARTGEINKTAEYMLSIYNDTPTVKQDGYLATQFKTLRELSAEMTTAIEQAKTKSLLEEKDSVRDGKISALNSILKGFMAMPIPEMSAAATRLYEIFSRYGTEMSARTYKEESTLIASFLEDFSSDAAKKDIAQLNGLEIAVSELQAAQKDFDDTYLELNKTQAEEAKNLIPATKIGKSILAVVNDKIVPYLNTMVEVNAEMYGDFADRIEKLINETNQTIANRSSKKTEE